ncbi:hypothetical protein CSAL01_12331 [Colletotrichum salicis]|uniref:Uncharacterized protein n=1 Tax=Colletotrichum salicis TaxID=1209931 RepID=A0A135ULN1_9PEZI|nr:hypothetical protein CSAL01_12331 [Colletotrichum salicis]
MEYDSEYACPPVTFTIWSSTSTPARRGKPTSVLCDESYRDRCTRCSRQYDVCSPAVRHNGKASCEDASEDSNQQESADLILNKVKGGYGGLYYEGGGEDGDYCYEASDTSGGRST